MIGHEVRSRVNYRSREVVSHSTVVDLYFVGRGVGRCSPSNIYGEMEVVYLDNVFWNIYDHFFAEDKT